VKGLANDHAARIITARGEAPFASIEDVWRRSGVPPAALEKLADADAFACFGIDRRQALWRVRGLGAAPLPLFAAADLREQAREPAVALPAMTAGHEVVEDYRMLQLSLRAHPLTFLRAELGRRGAMPCAALARARDGSKIAVAGIVLIRQRPGAGNVTFITIEDETGVANIILWQRKFEAQRRIVMSATMIIVRGTVQREGEVIHIVADRLDDCSGLLRSVGRRDFPHRFGPGDGARTAGAPQEIRIRSRDFH
jgi:error-prone DNA polymerase